MVLNPLYLLLVLFAFYSNACSQPNNSYISNLNSDNGNNWVVNDFNNTILINATIPGGIYSDLIKNGIIGDILFKDNDVKTRWIATDLWIYTTKFSISNNIYNKSTINLVFDGIDTITNISINNHIIGATDNMFIKYKFDIKNYIVIGNNILQVFFDSPIRVAEYRSQEEMIPPICVPSEYNGECHVNQLRKMQASFAWDWGPAFPSIGIWKSVYLESYNSAIISNIITSTVLNNSDSTWYLSLKIYLEPSKYLDILEGHLISSLDVNNNSSIIVYKLLQEKINNSIETEMVIKINEGQVDTWWPNGLGKQSLYNLKVTFQSIKYSNEYFYKNIKIGFRTIELIQEPLTEDDEGLTFYFKVNNVPIFMKGSNWIPMHILPEYGYKKESIDYLLESVKDINANMLRVWGGGVYESDYFYEKCDELGILIWQDFMFACNMYPVNDNFIRSVSKEIEQNIRRLQYHPSIAIWAGNNENEVALRGNWYGTNNRFEHYKSEYIKLYVDTIKPIVLENDSTRQYIISSPSNGIKSEQEGYIAENPYDPFYGDTHYYNYIQSLWTMDTYPKTRFASEYGFQAIPSIDTLNMATNDTNDHDLSSFFMKHRQHSPGGYEIIINQIEKHLLLPNKSNTQYFDTLVYYSQINQAWSMKTESEFYRQSRYDWNTMGALYWQLNDVWQAPSWSSVEYSGRWKVLHYYAKNFFNPILISPRLRLTNDLPIFVINDHNKPIINGKIIVDTFSWNSLKPLSTIEKQIDVKGFTIEKYDLNIIVPKNPQERRNIFYRFNLVNENSTQISPFNYIFPTPLKDINGYSTPNIKIKLINPITRDIKYSNKAYNVSITTDGIGLFIWLEIPYTIGWFSDNGFILTESSKNIIFYSYNKINEKTFNKIVSVKIYHHK